MTRSQQLTRLVLTCTTLTLAIPLGSCATTTVSAVPTDKVACQAFRPIYWSGKDTPATAAEVKEHNAAWKAICKKPEPVKAEPVTFKDRWYEGTKTVATVFR
jgi:invasion protein IalB